MKKGSVLCRLRKRTRRHSKCFIRNKADVDLVSESGYRPSSIASQKQHVDILHLLKHNANEDKRENAIMHSS